MKTWITDSTVSIKVMYSNVLILIMQSLVDRNLYAPTATYMA